MTGPSAVIPVTSEKPSAIRAAFRSAPPPSPRPFWKRWFGVSDPKAAAVAVENILASKPFAEITAPEVSVAVREYGLSGSEVRSLMLSLFSRAVTAAVADDVLSDDELADLAALRYAIQIGEDDAISVEKTVIHPRFQKSVAEALADDRLTPEEKAGLERLSNGLRLSRTDLEVLYAPAAGVVMQKNLSAMIADHRVSPDELIAFGKSGAQLGLTLGMQPEAEAAVRRYGEFWKIENGGLTPINVPGRLQAGEECYFAASATWNELRRVTTRINAGNIGYSVRIAKGVYYRSPRVRLPSVKSDVLTQVDSGTIYITSKRVLFDGQLANKAVRLNGLIGFEAFSNGFALEKSTGKSPTIIIEGDAERACVILGAVLAQA